MFLQKKIDAPILKHLRNKISEMNLKWYDIHKVIILSFTQQVYVYFCMKSSSFLIKTKIKPAKIRFLNSLQLYLYIYFVQIADYAK